ncbi:uncharacterized protein LOC124156586 isoform X2 [Ischnura elegans]|uniref:uncharacterized protein LOC124156586 isoform X2 n=1 Tax=Ischnura elegans TaxID=197161 RepID=UPI001ED8BE77|nr:uncharacterized protein LOC124156586 isoform X2 [Ischnura elegans]
MWPGKEVAFFLLTAIQLVATSLDANAVANVDGQKSAVDPSDPASIPGAGGQEAEDPRPSWLREALPEVASFLRAHKFHEIDRRYRKLSDPAPQVARRAASFRLRHDGRRRRADHAKGPTREECKTEMEMELRSGGSFDGPLERFQWRTTASYFMCWFTMLRVPALVTLGRRCDNYATCLDPEDELANGDFRAGGGDREMPFACAQYSFCPDPCCPGKQYSSAEQCAVDVAGPCSGLEGQCVLRPEENTHLDKIALNHWNVSCDCSSAAPRGSAPPPIAAPANGTRVVLKERGGYEWQSRFGACVDIDECSLRSDSCDRQRESCLNLPGGYACVCRAGYVASSDNMIVDRGKFDLECVRDKALQTAAADMMAAGRFGKPAAEKGSRSFLQKALHALSWA